MARLIEVEGERSLEEHEAIAHLAGVVHELRAEARTILPRLEDRTVWMVNSTHEGGGVAEMLPGMITMLRELGVDTEWVVIDAENQDFFPLTKKIHNLIHGEGDDRFDAADRELFEKENRRNAEWMLERIRPRDILVVHDPQPMPLAAQIQEEVDVMAVWRCHIGLDGDNASTRAAWDFLAPYESAYQKAVFSAPEYIPESLSGRSTVIYPAIDPLTDKNRGLSLHKTMGVLSNASLVVTPSPVLTPSFGRLAERLQPDGDFAPANLTGDIGLATRPIVLQISRWDRLKGFRPLLEAFVTLKKQLARDPGRYPDVHRRRLELVRLIIAGPEPAAIQDDPEAAGVLEDLRTAYLNLDPEIQQDVALISLPMESRRENALMVNALQRAATVAVQNSLREGFGLTVTEAMWKGVPILSNSQACGPRQQVRDGLDGRLATDPEDPEELAEVLDEMLADGQARNRWSNSARRRVHDEFLIFRQLEGWFQLMAEMLSPVFPRRSG